MLACAVGITPSVVAQLDPGSYWLKSAGLQAWELDVDHDFDNRTAREEYYAGTNPFDPESKFELNHALDVAAEELTLSWESVLGVEYAVMETPSLEQSFIALELVSGDGLLKERSYATANEDRHFYRLDVRAPLDGDGDGLSSIEEVMLGTRSDLLDTDGDGLSDGDEVCVYFTDPLVPNPAGGTIRGTVVNDVNGDGDLSDGVPAEGVAVYLDRNYNRTLDENERVEMTDASGNYEFLAVQPGVYHVRQILTAPMVQTFPANGRVDTEDLLPDEVTNYTHAAPGLGDRDVPYGHLASDWPGEWRNIDFGASVDLVDPGSILVKPIGVRNRFSTFATLGSEFVTLPEGARVMMRFDESIVDGPGPDLLVYSIDSRTAGEQAELLVGADAGSMISLGTIEENDNTTAIDLADHGITGPIHFVECVGMDLKGSRKGFELVGVEAVNTALPDPSAHVVSILSTEVVEDNDFGRYFRDLPPGILVHGRDETPSTEGFRAGETMTVRVNAFDDLGIASVSLKVNGQTVALNADNEATVNLTNPGTVILEASTTDTGGQSATAQARYYILHPDGSYPFDASELGPGFASDATVPSARILSPGPGTVSSADVEIIAEMVGDPAVTSWTLEYAPVDLVDPYDLNAVDSDYIQVAAGTGNVYSEPIGTIPLSTLADGIYFVRLCAQNSPTKNACFGQVLAKNVVEADLRPQVVIDSPSQNEDVMLTKDIVGTITSARPLREWYVEYARADQVDLNYLNAPDPDWKRIADGTDPINTSSVIATFDGTMLKNNSYLLRVVAWNDIGLGWAEPLPLNVVGESKLGRNRLEFNDISVNLAGFPLTFTRVYDSIQAEEDGELGYGWSLDLQDPDIRETVPDTGVAGIFGATPFRVGTRVYITAPTGERLGFTFMPEPGAASAFGAIYKAVFEPDTGNYHQLTVPEGDRAFLEVRDDGTVGLFFFSLPYNPTKYVLTAPNGQRYTYHEDKGFLQAEDAHGNTVTLGRDGVDHSLGLGLTFGRDAQGRITSVTDPEGDVWTYGYDTNGDLVSVTDPDARVTTYTYLSNPAHYLDGIMDPLGRMPVRYEYDNDSGRLIATIDEAGNRHEVNWDPASFTGSVTDRRGNTTNVVYNERGNVIQRTDPMGNVTTLEYGDPANPDKQTAVIDARGERYEMTYNERGQLTRYKLPLTTGIAGANRLDYTYDDAGNLTKVRDFRNRVWDFEYDEMGKLTKYDPPTAQAENNRYSPEGLLIASEDDTGSGYALNYRYDANGLFAGVSDTIGYDVAVEFTKSGQPKGGTDARGQDYAFVYDRSGVPLDQEDPNGNSLTAVEQPDGSYERTDRLGNTDSLKVSSDGVLESYTMSNGKQIIPSYDPNRNLSTITDPNNNMTTYGYDAMNRVTSLTDDAGGIATAAYDAVGNVSEMVNRNGLRRTFVYDENRRLQFERWHDGTGAVVREMELTYSGGSGALDKVIDTQGTTVHTIDFGGTTPRPNNAVMSYHGQVNWRIEYNWTERGDATPSADRVILRANGVEIGRLEADYFGGRTSHHRWERPGTGGKNNVIQVRRNDDGTINHLHRKIGTGGTTHSISRYTYDSTGRIASIRHEDGAGALLDPASELVYARDAENRLTSVTQAANAATYAYDGMGQMTSATHTKASYPDETYSYDDAGNRTSSHVLTTAAVIGDANRITSIGDFSFLYDAEGNITRRTNTTTGEETHFAYDHRNRLIEATVHPSNGAAASDVLRFDYDFFDRMIWREINGTVTWIVHDRYMPIAEFADGADEPSAMYFYEVDQVDRVHGVWREATGERWFLQDHLGSIRGITDENGALLSWVDYDAFGNLQPGNTPAADEPVRFGARPYLSEIGLYDNRMRFYDPLIGRFTQEDPIRMHGGDFNLYRYVGNNPGSFTDPLGTTAALEQGLFDANLALVETLCSLSECVGNLWGGVVKGVINVESTDPLGDSVDCVIDLIPIPDWPPSACEYVKGKVEDYLDDKRDEAIGGVWKFLAGSGGDAAKEASGKVFKIIDVVVECGKNVGIETGEEEIGCSK